MERQQRCELREPGVRNPGSSRPRLSRISRSTLQIASGCVALHPGYEAVGAVRSGISGLTEPHGSAVSTPFRDPAFYG
jgi:hypothetical protein